MLSRTCRALVLLVAVVAAAAAPCLAGAGSRPSCRMPGCAEDPAETLRAPSCCCDPAGVPADPGVAPALPGATMLPAAPDPAGAEAVRSSAGLTHDAPHPAGAADVPLYLLHASLLR